jgi:PPOX class probable F420-dependent enzyme
VPSAAVIPASHQDLVECPRVAALTTRMPDGAPQTTVVWCDLAAGLVRINTMRGFQKERNMQRDPKVTLLCYDPRVPLRYLEIRGIVTGMSEHGARGHLDTLASKYYGRPVSYFGDVVPVALELREAPVLCHVRPLRIVARDWTHGAAPVTPARDSLASHDALFTEPIVGVLTTLLADGQPHSVLVWLDHDGTCARVNTTLERRSGRNLQDNPKVSLLVVDPGNTSRFVQVRGDAELILDGAEDHLDALTRAYTSHPRYYGHVFPEERRAHETRVIVRIHPRRVTHDAIHA